MNAYRGSRTRRKVTVLKNGVPLDPTRSQLVMNHSPNGFEWGYRGSGPAQLALALLLEETDTPTALLYYQEFKVACVATWGDSWELSGEMVMQWLIDQRRRAEADP